MPQLVPSHVAVPFGVPGQGEHSVPQPAVDVSSTQVPPQLCDVAGQAHAPFWQVIPPEHAYWAPQPPQFWAFAWSLFISSTHCWLHSVGAVVGQSTMQRNSVEAAPESPAGEHAVPPSHAVPHAPQWPGSERFVAHPVPASAQSAYPGAHW
jgi:hypothetical protein